ncbi:MAG: ribonuclease HI family protein [Myxococcota bacterium]
MSPARRRGATLRVYTDGAARGNPGPAGAGVHIEDETGAALDEASLYLGEATNNVAEYRALLLGLERAGTLGAARVEIRADSELVVRQMTGQYRVRNPALQVLHRRARELERGFERVDYVHVPREQNLAADRLANRAIDGERAAPGSPAAGQS